MIETRHPRAAGATLVPSLAGALTALVGVGVLIGWSFNITALKSVQPGWGSMKPNTALGFILAGIALLSARSPLMAFSRLSRLGAWLAGRSVCSRWAKTPSGGTPQH